MITLCASSEDCLSAQIWLKLDSILHALCLYDLRYTFGEHTPP